MNLAQERLSDDYKAYLIARHKELELLNEEQHADRAVIHAELWCYGTIVVAALGVIVGGILVGIGVAAVWIAVVH